MLMNVLMDQVILPFTQGNYDRKVFSETKLHTCRIKFMTVIQFILKYFSEILVAFTCREY